MACVLEVLIIAGIIPMAVAIIRTISPRNPDKNKTIKKIKAIMDEISFL